MFCVLFVKMDLQSQQYLLTEPVSAIWNREYFLINPQTAVVTAEDKE